MTGLERLIRMPYGCGEQNMVAFVPNIVALKYLNCTNQVNDELREKALLHMETGYQKELTYKHHDGSYSAFGSRDRSGSLWYSLQLLLIAVSILILGQVTVVNTVTLSITLWYTDIYNYYFVRY